LKVCYVGIDRNESKGTFVFPDVNKDMSMHILKHKSWMFTTWNNNSEMIEYLEMKKDGNGNTVATTKYGVGFIPVLVKHLQGLGFLLLNNDGTPFDIYKDCSKVNYPMLRYQLRNYQYDCVLKWERDRLGVIKSSTGSGKTVMGCYIIKKSSFRTLILVHTIDLINVWKESLVQGFGVGFENRIGIFGGGKSLDEALAFQNNVVIGTYQSALKEGNLSKLDRAGFGLIVNDEVHHCPCNTFKHVLNTLLIPCKVGLSATPRRLDGKESDIYALVDSIKASVSIHGLIKDGFVVRPDFYNIQWTDYDIVRRVANSGKSGLQQALMLKKMSSTSHKKIAMLIKLLQTLQRNNETFLLFADFVESAKTIEFIVNEMITKYDSSFKVKMISQKMKSDERHVAFKQVGKKYRGLVFAKLGSEGIDISAVDNVIIMSPSKSPTTFAQRTGRAMRPMQGKTHCNIFQFILKGSSEENWSEYSFDEYRQEGFVQKRYVII